ncbi:MAG: acetylxylan esterase, partial [Bryobacteraceae bacterium]
YALATAYYGDIEPDFSGAMEQGVRALFLQPGQTQWPPNSWGALGAWAWGLSRIADYLQSDPAIDGKRIAIFGFSRLGKAALWAAAQDQRFNLVLSNESGVGGASLYRAKSAETIEHLNTAFPHWFCANFHEYTGHPDRVPVDGNLLLSLIAPRPLYVGSAEQDTFSCPPAEFLSTVLASKVYRLLGKRALGPNEHMPPVNHPVIEGNVAYHVRTGKHNVTEFDWEQYLHFMDLHFKQH